MPTSASNPYQGVISITRKGTGFFPYDEKEEDLIIPFENLGTAIHGDIVKVVRAGMAPAPVGKPARPAGKVVEIVSRNRTTFVGTLVRSEETGNLLLSPDWKRLHVPLRVEDDKGVPLGHKVLVKMTGWAASAPCPSGDVIEDIGVAGVHDVEMRALVLSQGFSSEFPPSVVTEAKKLEETGRAIITEGATEEARRDFRLVPTFTIDPVDAKDFDDALSVQKLDGGKIEVGVHIADVSHFVRIGNAIDREAKKRATSVYLVDRTIPMLPDVLSADLCSLRPDEDRLSVSAVFTLDTDANVLDTWFGKTVIHSAKRFTYEEAQEVLDAQAGPHLTELNTLRDLARKIRAKRVAEGAIEFDTAEVKIELDASGKPVAVRLKERKETNLLIEDFMLLANVAVAKHLAELGKNGHLPHNFLYRVHDAPEADKIETLALFLRVLGYDLEHHAGRVKGTSVNELLAKVKGKPEEYLVKTATLRSMAKAVYTTKNIGHFGLAFTHYTHFTSPIRRYPDLLVHRMLKHHLGTEPVSRQEMEEFEELAIHASEREVSAVEAERDSIKMKQVEFLAERVGEAFDAVISGVSERGLFVELVETHAEGMIKMRDLGDDYYTYDEKRYRLAGERAKKEFRLGDPIRVTLAAARVADKELDFVPSEK